MFSPWRARLRTTQSMPAMTWETSVTPYASASFTLTIRAPGATPTKPSSPFWTFAGTFEPRPAMIPARWVPWPKVSR